MQFAHLVDISERTFRDDDLFLRSMHEYVLRTQFQLLLLRCESGFFSKTVNFPDSRKKQLHLKQFTIFFIHYFKIILKASLKAEATRSIISNCVQPIYVNKSQMI